MNLKSIKLDNENYHDFLIGKEVICRVNDKTTVGEQVLVLKDTTANHTNAAVPTRERQADYIGVNGAVTAVLTDNGSEQQVMIRKF